MAEIVEIRDFAAGEIVPQFRVGEDIFNGLPDIPLGIMQQVAKFKDVQKTVMETGDLESILGIMDELLEPESARLFRVCVKDKKTIGVRRLMNIIPWLMEQYGLRPTQPSLASSAGSSDGATGTTSEAGASASVSTS